jgi:outer membrane protein assembly factor BamA
MNRRSTLSRIHRTGTLTALLLAACLCAPATLTAADGEDTVDKLQEQTEAAAEALGAKRFFIMPIPIANPTIGNGLGIATMYLFQAGENAPPSSVSLAGFYTDTESWATALGTETYFKDDKYRLAGWIGHFDVNLKFFGIGSDAGDRGESIGINQSGEFFNPSFKFRVADNFYLGLQYRLVTLDTTVDRDDLPPEIPDEGLPVDSEDVTSGLGILLDYDTRDNKFYPHHGSFLNVKSNFAGEALGSDRNYQQYEVGYNLYRELGENKIIAWRSTACFMGGDAPYYDLCQFGGESDAIRGYIGGQYRDDVSLTTQVEYRWRFYKRLGMVAFAGIGEVAPKVSDMNSENILHSLGGGIRFRASEEQRVNLSIDYAVGKDSNAWYFRIGEAF